MNKLIQQSLIILLVFLSSNLFASALKKVELKAEATPPTPKPAWTKSNYHAKQGYDFIGLSQLWVAGIAQAEAKSVQEACTDGLGKVSEYFSVKIASNSSASQVVADEQFQGQFSVSTDKISTLNLSGIKSSGTYSEVVDNGEYIQSYCLYRFNQQAINRIQQRLDSEQAEITQLVGDVSFALSTEDIEQAKISLALLSSKPNVSPVLVEELNKLVTEFGGDRLNVVMNFSQPSFKANDKLSVQLNADHNLFVYEFVDDGRFTSMLLPSPSYSFNLLEKDKVTTFPSQQQLKSRNFYKIPRLSQLNKVPKVYLVASKKRLATPFIQRSFNRFIVKDKTGFRDFIGLCRTEKYCSVIEQDITLDKTSIPMNIQTLELSINSQSDSALYQTLQSNLLEQGFDFAKDGYQILVEIKYSKRFSKKLSADMFIAELAVYSVNSHRRKRVLRLRQNSIYDSIRINSYLEAMLQSAAIKLQRKVEVNQGEL